MEINEIIYLILAIVILCFLLWFQHNEGKKELNRFYNNIEIGDKYLNIPNRKNPFNSAIEELYVLDKKDGYLLCKIKNTKTGEEIEKSYSASEFQTVYFDCGLEKQNTF